MLGIMFTLGLWYLRDWHLRVEVYPVYLDLSLVTLSLWYLYTFESNKLIEHTKYRLSSIHFNGTKAVYQSNSPKLLLSHITSVEYKVHTCGLQKIQKIQINTENQLLKWAITINFGGESQPQTTPGQQSSTRISRTGTTRTTGSHPFLEVLWVEIFM